MTSIELILTISIFLETFQYIHQILNNNGALYKLLIPYIPVINSHDKALFLDLDIKLFDEWTSIFEQEPQKSILAAKDVGIN
jgi:hypothetical protein